MDSIGRSQVLSTSECVILGCPASYDCKENLENLVLLYLMLFTNQTESSIQEHAWGRKKDTYITRATSNRELIVVDKCTHRLRFCGHFFRIFMGNVSDTNILQHPKTFEMVNKNSRHKHNVVMTL